MKETPIHTIQIDESDTDIGRGGPSTTTLQQDLRELRRLKEIAEAAGRVKRDADSAFKLAQWSCLDRMEREETSGIRDTKTGYLFTLTPKDKFNVNDREAFVQWALDNEPDLVEYREIGSTLNALGRAALDNNRPLPPGVDHFPDPYISQRKG